MADQPAPDQARRLPGDEGVWFFICADAIFFLLLFGTYSYYRAQDLAGFAVAQAELHPTTAALNTGFLLTSSWCVARAVAFGRIGETRRVVGTLRWAIVLGLAFVATKVGEYAVLAHEGAGPGSSQFFMYYVVITGIHLLHVLAGLTVLAVCAARATGEPRSSGHHHVLESAGAFWHMVDILWLFIFPLLYLIGRVTP